jgi:hypothetical protein
LPLEKKTLKNTTKKDQKESETETEKASKNKSKATRKGKTRQNYNGKKTRATNYIPQNTKKNTKKKACILAWSSFSVKD